MQPKHRSYTDLDMQLMRQGWPIHNLPHDAALRTGMAPRHFVKRLVGPMVRRWHNVRAT